MSNQQNESFLDKKTIFAIVLVGMSWIGWSSYMKKKYPNQSNTQKVEKNVDTVETVDSSNVVVENNSNTSVPNPTIVVEKNVEKILKYSDEFWSFEISSYGMSVKNINLNTYSGRDEKPITFGNDNIQVGNYSLSLLNSPQPINFNISQVSKDQFRGEAVIGDTTIIRTVTVKSNKYVFENDIQVNGVDSKYLGLSFVMNDLPHIPESGGFLLPSFDHQEIFVNSKEGTDRVILKQDEEVFKSYNKASLVSIGTQYFTQAFVNKADVIPNLTVEHKSKDLVSSKVDFPYLSGTKNLNVKFITFSGPKKFDLLVSIDESLGEVVNFGMFSSIAKYILKLMKWFYELTHNWGISIILLTLLVRLIVLPFAMMSFKSMKNMQMIQPQIKAIREKYKDDQARVNAEMVTLMKTHKVNPVGGCLPMLLQFPIFIALYQVLGQSIELYKSPFYFWITDLSLKDPFYVLPVLMGVTMFLQQKLTPTTMDPAQAKILMFMPLIFTFFMISLPSGLTLYIFISSLFGILQQMYFLRSKEQASGVARTA